MELSDEAKEAVRHLGDAINSAIEKSTRVVDAIEHLRQIGYEPNLSLRLEIGLHELTLDSDESAERAELDLTDDDLRTLQRMKIRLE